MDDDWVSVTPPGPEQVREQPVSDVLSGGYVIPNVRVGMLEQDEALGRLRLDQDSTLHTLHTLEQMNAALTAENARLKRALALHENDITWVAVRKARQVPVKPKGATATATPRERATGTATAIPTPTPKGTATGTPAPRAQVCTRASEAPARAGAGDTEVEVHAHVLAYLDNLSYAAVARGKSDQAQTQVQTQVPRNLQEKQAQKQWSAQNQTRTPTQTQTQTHAQTEHKPDAKTLVQWWSQSGA